MWEPARRCVRVCKGVGRGCGRGGVSRLPLPSAHPRRLGEGEGWAAKTNVQRPQPPGRSRCGGHGRGREERGASAAPGIALTGEWGNRSDHAARGLQARERPAAAGRAGTLASGTRGWGKGLEVSGYSRIPSHRKRRRRRRPLLTPNGN